MGKAIRFRWCLCLLLGLCWSAGPEARAELITASTHQGGGIFFNFERATGWYFRPTEDITVFQLGLFDAGQDGLFTAHDVGLFRADGTIMAVAVIQAGTASPLIGQSRFENIVPVMLFANTDYYIVGNNFLQDQYVFGTGAIAYAPEITWRGFGEGDSNSIFSRVTNRGGLPGNLGPNFRYETQAIPEPAAVTLLGMGALGLLGYGWRRRRVPDPVPEVFGPLG